MKQSFGFLLVLLVLAGTNHSLAQIGFTLKQKIKTIADINGVQIEDMNNDGLSDIIFATNYSWDYTSDDAKIYIYHQDTIATFHDSIVINYPKVYPGIYSFDIGDMNNDGLKDLVIAYSDSIAISYQDSINSFSKFNSHYCARTILQLYCLDVNGDKLDDIVAANNNFRTELIVFFQNESGLRKTVIPDNQPYRYQILEIGNYNNDSIPDFLFYHNYNHPDTNIFVGINTHNNLFQSTIPVIFADGEIERTIHSLSMANYSNPDWQDIFGLNTSTDSIYYWENENGTLKVPLKIPTYEYAKDLSLADFNCDGINDILAFAENSLTVHNGIDLNTQITRSNIAGQYSSATPWHNTYDLGDLNNDAKTDIAIAYLDGVIIMGNTSAPDDFRYIDTLVNIDTLFYMPDTIDICYVGYITVIDSISNPHKNQIDSFRVYTIAHNVDSYIDTTFIRTGELCNGIYTDTITTENQYHYLYAETKDSVLFQTVYTDINETGLQQGGLNIYPNPADNVIYIVPKTSRLNSLTINIVSLNGIKILSSEIHFQQNYRCKIDISNLPAGYYFANYILNNKSYSMPFIKK